MKKVGEIMKEMGFNPESSEDTQKAFIKYLIRVANKNRLTPEPFTSANEQDCDEWQELKLHSKGYKAISDNNQELGKQDKEHKQEQLCFEFISQRTDGKAC